MPFGRTGKHNNRSQHNLAGPTVGGGAISQAQSDSVSAASNPAPPASSNSTALNSSESFDHSLRPNQPPPSFLQHSVNLHSAAQGGVDRGNNNGSDFGSQSQLHHSNTVSGGAYDSRRRDADVADQVSRSQSQRYPQQLSPVQTQQQYGLAAEAAESLHETGAADSPGGGSQQGPPPQRQQPQLPSGPPPKKQSTTRKLFKNILTGNNNKSSSESPHHNQQQQTSQNSYNNTGGLARRASKRNPLDFLHTDTIRQVPAEADRSPYSPDEVGFYQRQQAEIQLHGPSPELQQRQFNFDQEQQQQHQYGQQQPYPNGAQQLFPGHQQNPETVSQLSHESPVSDWDQRSATNTQTSQSSTTLNQPPQPYNLQTQDIPGRHPGRQVQTPSSAHSLDQPQASQQQNMAPPPGPPPSRRSQEAEKAGLSLGAPPSYRHSQPPNMNSPLPPPPPSAGIQPPPNYRQSSLQERQAYEGQGMEGRNSPQPSNSDRGDGSEDKALKDLLVKYKNVKRLYFDGKKEIEQLSGQVEQLQNAIANQRMSQSRTSLDDNEYQTRFNRLNGAINNLSFNIRKDWKTLPSWLAPYITVDALKTGKQEMTAIGRAVITRWLVEEVFNRCFHPCLDPELSLQLKQIEQNIRHNSYALNSQEEFEALTNKVVSWRMTTLEGLAQVLHGPESEANRVDFVRKATTNLTAFLYQHLAEPAPPGVEGSAGMIVELAVGIAMNMPLESRDVAITYPLPEQQISPHIMEVEKAGLPALESRPPDDGQDEKDGAGGKKGDKSKSAGANNLPPKDPGKVRFAGFVAVEVRGRSVLVKAPVWTLG